MAKVFRIYNQVSGADLGAFQADDPRAALEVMARDMGYQDYAEACELAPGTNDEMLVVEVLG